MFKTFKVQDMILGKIKICQWSISETSWDPDEVPEAVGLVYGGQSWQIITDQNGPKIQQEICIQI